MDAGESWESAWSFIDEQGVTLPVLLDTDRALYSSYSRTEAKSGSAPYPLHVIIDRNGIVRYLSYRYDAAEVVSQIRTLLAEP